MLNQLVLYEPVLRLIRELGGGTLLDVGSGSVGARRWLGAEWNITAVDADFQDYGTATGPAADGAHRVVGDVRGLEFPASRFDVVLALDLLEHIDRDDRPQALGELARVARQRLIVACPAGRPALDVDRRLARLYASRGWPEPGWLADHLANGFPEPRELVEPTGVNGRIRVLGNENVHAHYWLMRPEAGPWTNLAAQAAERVLAPSATEGRASGAARQALRLLRGGDRPPTYRTIAVVGFDADA